MTTPTNMSLQARSKQTGCATMRADCGGREVLAGFATAQRFIRRHGDKPAAISVVPRVAAGSSSEHRGSSRTVEARRFCRAAAIMLVALGLLALGCGDEGSAPNDGQEWTELEPEDRGPIDVAGTEQALGRAPRRMSVQQLRTTIPALFDGITWEVNVSGTDYQVFDVLAPTLGEADYIRRTDNDLTPSPLFAKFMDDMAGSVCEQAVTRDAATNDLEQRLVIRHPDDPDANLRFLRLKLHNIHVPDDSMQGLEDLRQLYDDIESDPEITEDSDYVAWYGVCVAMLTAPEFMAY